MSVDSSATTALPSACAAATSGWTSNGKPDRDGRGVAHRVAADELKERCDRARLSNGDPVSRSMVVAGVEEFVEREERRPTDRYLGDPLPISARPSRVLRVHTFGRLRGCLTWVHESR